MVRKRRGIKRKKLHLLNEESKYTKPKQGGIGKQDSGLVWLYESWNQIN